MPAHDHRQCRSADGFTLVEMLVVAPVVLLVIAGIVSAMVTMIGDALISNARSTTVYQIHETLSRIEQDARVSIHFLNTFAPTSTPQGRDGTTASFTTASSDLIMTQQATDSSPYDAVRNLVVYKNQPNDCAADTSTNKVLLTRSIYFVQTNTDGTKTLWRRSIVNPSNQNSTVDVNTTCTKPWQRNTCPRDKMPATICQGTDEKMLDNISTFTTTYIDASGTTTTSIATARTIRIAVTVEQKIAGKTISQSGSIEATRINDIAVSAL